VGPRAFITGVAGQDGAYLAKFLLEKGYRVFGGVRRGPPTNLHRLEELAIASDVELVDFDFLQPKSIFRAIERTAADEVYNLAAQSSVELSFEQPIYTCDCSGLGAVRILEALKTANPTARFFQASTCEMFGNIGGPGQNETSQLQPHSPYAVAKLYAHWMTVNYRQTHGLHASAGIMFNHESPLRSQEFVSRKITRALARIKSGFLDVLELGNLNAERDWGYAPDYVEGMWLIANNAVADDYVLATGEAHSIREFVTIAGKAFELDIAFEGLGYEERGIDVKTGRVIVTVNPRLMRSMEVDSLRGDARKAARVLGWKPRTSFAEMVALMAQADARRIRDALATAL
jgi:GDPmannose 4,6-dehydratase